MSKKNGKGEKNYDIIFDSEVGKDSIYVNGSVKGFWIDNYKSNAFLIRGKNDVMPCLMVTEVSLIGEQVQKVT